MTVNKLFHELANCFAVTVDDTLCYPQYFNPEDRCGDDSQPMVEMLDADICIEPSDVDKVVATEYVIFVTLKDKTEFCIQFLNVKKFEADQFEDEQSVEATH